MPSTVNERCRQRASARRPRLPLSLPVMTMTSSPLRILFIATPYSTSGASETIFMNRSLRSSRVTGPKIRVPIGSSLAFNRTAALPSNLISEPSWRRHALGGANHHSVVDFAFLHAPARRCFFDGHLDDVANAGITTLRAAEHLDAHALHAHPCCRPLQAEFPVWIMVYLSQLNPVGTSPWRTRSVLVPSANRLLGLEQQRRQTKPAIAIR